MTQSYGSSIKNPIRHKQPFVFNNYVRPVQLPSSCALPGTYCKVSGWGARSEGDRRSDQLQSLGIPILTTEYYPYYTDRVNTETMLVAGAWEGGKGKALSYSMNYRDL